jgi:putative ABC transport system permease protein
VPQTLRFALRRLRRAPGYTAAAVLCLALGIGANTAIFTVVNAVLLRPLPFEDPDRVVGVWEANDLRRTERNSVAPANFLDWRAQNTVFSDMAAVHDVTGNLTGSGAPEEITVQQATASLFPVLGLAPDLGRTFSAVEDRPDGPSVAVLSHELWVRRYGADRGVIGRSVWLDGRAYTVVGVMPAGTQTIGRGKRPDLWIPIGLDPAENYRETAGRFLLAVARLKPGVSLEQARAELGTIAARLEATYPNFNTHWHVNLVPITEQVVGAVRRPLALLSGMVVLVLLIACANVANLQLAQATARRREIAVHAALGAGGLDVGRQFLIESLIVAAAGGGLGVLLAWWGTDALAALAASSVPRMEEVGLDWSALAFTLAVSTAAGLSFGVLSAVHAVRGDLHTNLKDSSRGSSAHGHRTRAALVGAQVALSIVLLAGAGLLLKSFARLNEVDLGFNPDRVLTARVSLSGERYEAEESQVRFFQELIRGVSALPGVHAVGAIDWLPLAGQRSATRMIIEGEPAPRAGEEPGADVRAIDPGFFPAMEMPLLRGRSIESADSRDAPKVVVVSEAFADRYLGGRDPIGRRIRMEWGDTLVASIVGVVGDIKHTGVDSVTSPTVYWALPQFPRSFMTLVVRTADDPRRLAPAVTAQVLALDPQQPVADLKTFDNFLGGALARRRFNLLLVAGFAALAVALTAIGLYGTTSYGVGQRTREFGIRLALGAPGRTVLWGVLRSVLGVVAVGVVVGVAGAAVVTRLLSGLLFEVSATDPAVFAGIIASVLLVGTSASFVPALRATRVDPMVAIREE